MQAQRKRNKRSTPWQVRFWKYVTPGTPEECWEWAGSLDTHRYGRLQRGRRGEGVVKAHRASYEIHFGPFDSSLDVCHRCDNPPCCNPAHLFLGDAKTNAQDMARKGRAAAQRGHDNGRTKLSDAQVREIRERAASGEFYGVIAADYDVRPQWVSEVARGNRRARAGGPLVPTLNHAQRRAKRDGRAPEATA